MNDRGMKKWLAYKSLTNQKEYLEMIKKEKAKVAKPLISQDKAEEIDYILRTYVNEVVSVSFYLGGYLTSTDGYINHIDPIYKFLEINDMRILFRDIIDVVVLE